LLRLTNLHPTKSAPSTKATGHSRKGSRGPPGSNGFGTEAVTVRGVVVTVIVVLLPAFREGGLNVAMAPTGKPVAVNVTFPGKAPPTGAVAITNIAG